jgi:hypothetical protein
MLRRGQPEAYKAWALFFGRSAEFVRAAAVMNATNYQLNVRGMESTRFEGSSNWSGAYVVPTGGNMVVAIMGIWTVPTLTTPPPPETQADPNAAYECSTWIGLDGQRLYLNSSLPQIGTTQILPMSNGVASPVSAQAWFQWWDRQTGGPPANLNIAVAPGDEVACLLWVLDPRTVGAYFLNLTSNQIALVTASAPIVGGTQLTVSGATAEWIMERPTKLGSTAFYGFPDYADTKFCDCIALTGLAPPIPDSFKDLETARLIRLYDTLANPPRNLYISMPTKLDDTTVQMTYGDSFP